MVCSPVIAKYLFILSAVLPCSVAKPIIEKAYLAMKDEREGKAEKKGKAAQEEEDDGEL